MKKHKQQNYGWMLLGGLAALGAAAAAGAYWRKRQDESCAWCACDCGEREPDFPEHMAPQESCCCHDDEDAE